MAATTFSIDTPLYIAGVVGTRGIAGNWEWWSFGIAHVVMIYVFARLWRRSEIVTDAELTEIRYGGRMAAVLRGIKAFLFAVPINCIGIGYAMLAMVKVIDALQIWQSLGFEPGEAGKLWSVIGVSVLVLLYAGFSGLWGVVVTDFFQFFLALFGAIVVAIAAVNHVGGMRELVTQVQSMTDVDVLSLVPVSAGGSSGWLQWSKAAGITSSTFFAYVFLQWWAFRRSDGGGEFIQRLAAAKDENEAAKSAWFFNILHYVVRTWPWVIVALAAIVVYPDLEDRELGYPLLMLDFLPPVLLGLVVASLVAAFMSTVSTLINWGASYLTNDLYGRFIKPSATQTELVFAGRIASVIVTIIGAAAAFSSENVTDVFRLVIAIGTGPGLVLILRWFWWRINAAAELSSMLAGFLVGFLTGQNFLNISDFGLRLLVTATITTLVWVSVMYLTSPESDETLDQFYQRVHPGGPGWNIQRQRAGESTIHFFRANRSQNSSDTEATDHVSFIAPSQDLILQMQQVVASLGILFGAMFAIGGFLLFQSVTGWVSLIVAVLGYVWLRRLNKRYMMAIATQQSLQDTQSPE